MEWSIYQLYFVKQLIKEKKIDAAADFIVAVCEFQEKVNHK